MNIIRVSATKARNNFFELLNLVAAGKSIVIEKDNKEIAILSPKVVKTDLKKLLEASRRARGILKDYDPKDNPLRNKDAWKSFGMWDQ